MRCRWRRRAEENTGGRERRKREIQSGCGGKAAEGKTGGKRKHRRNERKIKSKAGNQTVSLFLLSGNYTSIKAQLKEKTHQAYQVSDRLKQSETRFCVFFYYFFYSFYEPNTPHEGSIDPHGCRPSGSVTPRLCCMLCIISKAEGQRDPSWTLEKARQGIQTTEIMKNSEHRHEETTVLIS